MSTQVQSPIGKPIRLSWIKRVNFRLIAFLIIVSALPLAGLYSMISYQLHGGIERGKGVLIVDLQSLGNFPFDQSGGSIRDIPSRWRDLDGKRVQLTGYFYGDRQAGGDLTQFQVVYNLTKCCFSGPPQVQERVFAFVPDGKRIPFYEFGQVTGVLHVKVQQDGGKISSVYTLDVESAEPVG